MQSRCPSSLRPLLGLFAAVFISAAHAGSGSVDAVQYPAWLERQTQRTPLEPGQALRSGDTLVTGNNARILARLGDGSEIKLGADTHFQIDRLRFQNHAGIGELDTSLKLIKGFFRYTTSTLGKLNGKRAVELSVKTATIGVRGTDYWAMTDDVHDAVCVFEGKVEVAPQDQSALLLDQPTAFWARFFEKPPVAPGHATPEELTRFVASVEPIPGQGVAIINGRWRIIAGAEATAPAAQALGRELRNQGYPAQIVRTNGRHEVRIDHFASRADATAVLQRLRATPGLSGANAAVMASR